MMRLLLTLAVAIILARFVVPPMVSAANTMEVIAGFTLLLTIIVAVGYVIKKTLLESKK